MRSFHLPALPALPRRDRRRAQAAAARRTRRRAAGVAAGLAFGLIAAVGVTAATPVSGAAASGVRPDFALASYTVPEPSTTITASGTAEISAEARSALADADEAITAAQQIATAIEHSGLDVGGQATVETADLETAMQRLDAAKILPAPLVPDFTAAVAELTTAVDDQVTELQAGLAEAERVEAERVAAEKKAAEEAAAKAAAEAAAAASRSASSTSIPALTLAAAGTTAAQAQEIARGMIGGYGWGEDQFPCLVSLWNRESGWNYQAYNSSSGAYGIPQALPGSKMATAGADWQTNAATQIRWGLGYIQGRYGSPCGAWSHSQSSGWY